MADGGLQGRQVNVRTHAGTPDPHPTPSRAVEPVILGALVSGTGRTVANIHAVIARGELPARLGVVIGSREDLPAVQHCRALGIPTVVVPPEPKETFDDRVDAALRAHGVQLVCLCGYLRHFRVGSWRALNVHPALLPEFGGAGMYGIRVHQEVLRAGRTTSGCTVHWVDEEYDHGPPLLQLSCPVLPEDTPETLARRVFELECAAYPRAILAAIEELRRIS